MGKYYGVDAMNIPYSQFLNFIENMTFVKRWEDDKDPFADPRYEYAKSLDQKEFVQAVREGKIPHDILINPEKYREKTS